MPADFDLRRARCTVVMTHLRWGRKLRLMLMVWCCQLLEGFRTMTAVAKTLPGRSLQLDPTPCNVSWNDGTQVLVYGGVSDYCLHIGSCSILCPEDHPCACTSLDSGPRYHCLGCYTQDITKTDAYYCVPPSEGWTNRTGLRPQPGDGQTSIPSTAGICGTTGTSAQFQTGSPASRGPTIISSALSSSPIPPVLSPTSTSSSAVTFPSVAMAPSAPASEPSEESPKALPAPPPPPSPSPVQGKASHIAGKLWGSLSGVLALLAACIAVSAWLYVVLRHRQEKQMLTYGIITYIKPSDITTNTPDSTEPNQIKSGISDMVDNAIIALRDQSPSKAIKDTAQDITAWCMLRWGGPFGARAGTNSMGAKLGIWSDRFENVQCAVMLLAFRRVNAALMLKHQKARIGSDEPGCLLEAWHQASPDQKTQLVTDISQVLLGISREDAQALSPNDAPSPSMYEKVSSLLHRNRQRLKYASSSARIFSNTSTQTSINRADSVVAHSNTSQP